MLDDRPRAGYNKHMDRDAFIRAAREGGLSGAWLLHGEEEFVKDAALSALTAALDPATRDLNMDVLESAAARGVVNACETLPFLAERRLVVVRALPKEEDAAALAPYLARVPPTTLAAFFLRGKADGRSAFVKAMAKAGRVVEFAPLTEAEAARWVTQQCLRANVTITRENAAFFVSLAGTDCARLNNEFQKAAAYAGDGAEITKEILSKVVTRDLDFVVFEVLDHFLAERAADGLRTLRGVIADGEKPLMIAERLREKAKLTLQARRLLDAKTPKEEITRQLAVSPGYAWRLTDAARRLSKPRLASLARCVEGLCGVTTGQLTGKAKAEDALEQALLRLAVK